MRAAAAVIHNFASPLLVGESRAELVIARRNVQFVVTTAHTAAQVVLQCKSDGRGTTINTVVTR